MTAFFLIPLSAFLADLLLIIVLRRRRDTFGRAFLLLAIFLAGANLLLVFQLISADEKTAGLLFHAMRHALFPVPVLLLALSVLLSGRKLFSPVLLLPLGLLFVFIVLINLAYFSGSSILVAGMKRHAFGFFPVLNTPGLLLLSTLFGGCFLLSMAVLLQPKEASVVDHPLKRRLPVLFFLWWVGFSLNLIPLSGQAFPPVGMAVDALICILFASHLISSEDRLFHTSEILGALSSGALGGTLVLLLLPDQPGSVQTATVMIACALSALLWTRIIRSSPKPSGDFSSAALTKQENRICELINEGYSRKQIAFFLGVTEGTLRNHLMNIYAKLLDGDDGRDRFQRLTVLIKKASGKA